MIYGINIDKYHLVHHTSIHNGVRIAQYDPDTNSIFYPNRTKTDYYISSNAIDSYSLTSKISNRFIALFPDQVTANAMSYNIFKAKNLTNINISENTISIVSNNSTEIPNFKFVDKVNKIKNNFNCDFISLSCLNFCLYDSFFELYSIPHESLQDRNDFGIIMIVLPFNFSKFYEKSLDLSGILLDNIFINQSVFIRVNKIENIDPNDILFKKLKYHDYMVV